MGECLTMTTKCGRFVTISLAVLLRFTMASAIAAHFAMTLAIRRHRVPFPMARYTESDHLLRVKTQYGAP